MSGNPTFPVYFGSRITFTSTQLINGSMYAVGNRTGEFGATNLAIGQYSPTAGQWVVLLDSSTDYYQFYAFTFDGFNLVEGLEATYLKTTLPTGYVNVIGNRIKSAQAAAGGNAPGVINAVRPAVAAGTDGNAAAVVSAQMPYQPSQSQVEVLHQLESVLQAYSMMRQ